MYIVEPNSMETNKTPFQKKFSKPIPLPPLAKNMHVLMHALADESLNFQQIAEVIKHYPEITARLIFLANSPWSAPISPVTSIQQACSRLGTSIVKSISITISIASSFDTGKCPGFSTTHYWITSLLVSEGAGLLASRLPDNVANLELEQTAQTAGVIHNLGLLWLADSLPIETDKAFQMISDESCSLSFSDALRQCTGVNYCEAGGWIARQLKLPQVLIDSMEHHLNDEYQGSSWETTLLVNSAACMASALYKQADEVPANTRLETLGLDASAQKLVYQQLYNNLDKTRELATTLFEGSG